MENRTMAAKEATVMTIHSYIADFDQLVVVAFCVVVRQHDG